MAYEKLLFDKEDGEEYPYSESFEDGDYYYRISVIWNEKDGEIHILNSGCHIQFDDGTVLMFNTEPEKLFPGKNKLTENELLDIMNLMANNEMQPILYTQKEVEGLYRKYLEYKKLN